MDKIFSKFNSSGEVVDLSPNSEDMHRYCNELFTAFRETKEAILEKMLAQLRLEDEGLKPEECVLIEDDAPHLRAIPSPDKIEKISVSQSIQLMPAWKYYGFPDKATWQKRQDALKKWGEEVEHFEGSGL